MQRSLQNKGKKIFLSDAIGNESVRTFMRIAYYYYYYYNKLQIYNQIKIIAFQNCFW